MVLVVNAECMDYMLGSIAKEKRTLVLTAILALLPIIFVGSLVTSGGCSPEGCSASAHLAASNPVLFILLGTVILGISYGLAIFIIFGVRKARSHVSEIQA